MNIRFSLTLLIATLFVGFHSAFGVIDQGDLSSLMAFYNGLNNKGSLNWTAEADLCLPQNAGYSPFTTSPIIVCNDMTPQRVSHLNMTGMGLVGTLATELGDLVSLLSLQLSNNQLSGPIPTQFAQLTFLYHLELHNNMLSGDLSFLSSLQNLNTLFLGGETNSFCPAFDFSAIPNNDLIATVFCDMAPFCTPSPCQNGASCSPFQRSCNCLTGFTGDYCQTKIICASVACDDANWPRGYAGQLTYGTCQTGFVGQPSRQCQMDGTYGPVLSRCYPATMTCPANTYNNVIWPETSVTTTSSGTCAAGYSGNPTRKCFRDGTWSLALNTYCTRNQCAGVTEGSLVWPTTNSLMTLSAKCPTGTSGTIQKTCQANGVWAETVNTCAPPPPCSENYYGRTTWPLTQAGLTATGVCAAGYSGSPKRICATSGTWQTLITNPCQRIKCPATTSGVISFGATDSGTKGTGICTSGAGNPYRYCNLNGSWGPVYGACS